MSEEVLRHDKYCRLCNSSNITTVFRLNDTPLEDQFLATDTIAQPVYPLVLAMCEDCGYLHLPDIVNPEASYADYAYVSGVTVGLRGHYDQYAEQIAADFNVPAGSLVVDLGSNDGSMLSSFKRLGYRTVGVEPAGSIAALANQSGLETINDFFTESVAQKISGQYGAPGVVTANYMYANIDDVTGFTKSVAKLLSPDGIFVVQTGYHPEQMKIRMFDYIYHEHFSYFTVDVLKKLFEACGLELIDAQKTAPKGGSVRIVAQIKGGNRQVGDSVENLIAEERAQGMHLADTYRKFALDIDASKNELLDLLKMLKAEGRRIAGFGASHSTTTLIYHFELAPYIEYLVDDNPLKHGKYSPGYHLPVYPSEKLLSDRPDYVLILGWQHQGSIIARHKLAGEGRWIVPLPKLVLI